MKGRDVLIGVAIGAALVLFLVNYHSGKSTPHPKSTVSASASHPKSTSKSHHSTSKKSRSSAAAAKHTPSPKPSGAAATAHPASQRPTTASQPSAHHLSAKPAAHTASAPAKSSGISDGLIVIACLIAIAAALSTVTMTVRGLRAAK
jgi:cytoskeletal protein RodZ